MKVIIFISPPAAGKGTVSSLISNKIKYPHISVGQMLRDYSKDNPKLHNELATGNFADINTVMEILEKRINQPDCQKGYILDGFPRTLEQAHRYDNLLKNLNVKLYVFVLNIDYEVAKERALNRLVCSTNGEVFNKNLISERDGSKYDECIGPLIKRSDDNEETFDRRFKTYEETSPELINFYQTKNSIYYIDANQEIQNVMNDINIILEGEI